MTDQEIKEDFVRFLRHEAMRANCKMDKVFKLICEKLKDYE